MKICMLVYNTYEGDNRVRRYVQTLTRRGDQVDVIALSSGNIPLGTTTGNGITVYHLQRRIHNERSKWTYAWRLLKFLVTSSILMTRRHREVGYDLIHVHNMPDFLVFAAWYPKLMGVKVILDIHDIVPELFVSKFGAGTESFYVRYLKLIERAAAAFSDHLIISNHLWHEKLLRRSVSREKSSVFFNSVDLELFYRHPRTRRDGKFIIIFPGTFQWHQGLDIAIEAFAKVRALVPYAELHLYGGGTAKDNLVRLVDQLGLNDAVVFGTIPYDEIAGVIANADMGIVPKRADTFGNEAYSTKIMEFMSQGIPVVVSRTAVDTYYFNDSVVKFFESGNSSAMAESMLQVIQDPSLRESLVANGLAYVSRNNWEVMREDYLKVVDSLAPKRKNSLDLRSA